MVRKKEGSSLVTVAIISFVLITVATAMVSMTVGDYKMRMTESTRIKNLYSSESGLDVAYDILVKTFDAATIYGTKQTEIYKTSPDITAIDDEIKSIRKDDSIHNKDEQIKSLEAQKNEMLDSYFKRIFYTFIDGGDLQESSAPNNENELRKSIKGLKYVAVDSNGNESYEGVSINTENTSAIDLFVGEQSVNDDDGIGYEEVPANLQNGKEYLSRNYTIKITSQYSTEDTNGKTKRKLQTIYNLLVPDYKDVAFSERNTELPKYTFMNDKAIIVGKNINVDNANFSVKGNIYVEGDGYEDLDGNEESRAYDKYIGGVVLNADSNKDIVFNGDVITGKTFNIRNNVNATINGNLYAMNVYAGNERADDPHSMNSTLDVNEVDGNGGEVVVDNDMTLKADNTDITIDKFYGVNDKNIKYNDQTGIDGTNKTDKPLGRTSSCIIVNGNENSNIKINKEAYIMGVAHINTTNGYNTGESVGVKDNYIAYSIPEEDDDNFTEKKFKDSSSQTNESLQLLDEDNVIKKSNHFVKYWGDKLELDNAGGIYLPIKTPDHPERNTYALGAIVYLYKDGTSEAEAKVLGSSYRLNNIPTIVSDKQKEFASKVYNVGGKNLTEDQKNSLYESLGNNKDKVRDLMNIDGVNDEYKNKNKIFFKEFDDSSDETPDEESNNEKAIFSDKNIIIQSSNKDEIVKDGEDIIISVNSNNTLNAFIDTSGDVTINGNVKIKGNIIAEGNMNIGGGSEQKSIQYDNELSNRIQASHVDLFDSVFGHMRDDSSENPSGGNTSNLVVEYDLSKFIKNTLWKIIK
ncbi:hypothetical protein AXY43_09330 [Clostridium sp. MF28]|uniref:pilus assembly PilX N-terminal domain-containing protein n=1 Tax=Clostridium TaxID=1485 RepID=UPI000CF851CB|nr:MULTISPECIES: pilus assembly PilX N-terminal domain-containing protein [Clostridium]AVK48213.1 hypothetical protein AXY43_09330 [Clostridium sp. MF28]PSM58410.1 hypothetical protein C4L39_07030 [Clostridium diolis]